MAVTSVNNNTSNNRTNTQTSNNRAATQTSNNRAATQTSNTNNNAATAQAKAAAAKAASQAQAAAQAKAAAAKAAALIKTVTGAFSTSNNASTTRTTSGTNVNNTTTQQSVRERTLTQAAAAAAGISLNSDGTPKINSASEAAKYNEARNKLSANGNSGTGTTSSGTTNTTTQPSDKEKELTAEAARRAHIGLNSDGTPKINSASDAAAYNAQRNKIKVANGNNIMNVAMSTSIRCNSTNGINNAAGKEENVTCQSTACTGGEYPGWNGCISTSIAAMFRINDGATGTARSLVNSDTDGSNPTSGTGDYSYSRTVGNSFANGNGGSQSDALEAIKNELAKGKVCCVKIDNGGGNCGHTIVCSGVSSGISLRDSTWSDLLFNDVGRGSASDRTSKPLSEMSYENGNGKTVSYTQAADNNNTVIIDTTK